MLEALALGIVIVLLFLGTYLAIFPRKRNVRGLLKQKRLRGVRKRRGPNKDHV